MCVRRGRGSLLYEWVAGSWNTCTKVYKCSSEHDSLTDENSTSKHKLHLVVAHIGSSIIFPCCVHKSERSANSKCKNDILYYQRTNNFKHHTLWATVVHKQAHIQRNRDTRGNDISQGVDSTTYNINNNTCVTVTVFLWCLTHTCAHLLSSKGLWRRLKYRERERE